MTELCYNSLSPGERQRASIANCLLSSLCRIGVLRWCVFTGGDVRALAAGGREFTISFFCKEYQLDFLLAQQKGPTVVSFWDGIVFGKHCRNPEKKVKSPSHTA